MHECVFCKIVKGETQCAKIWETETHLAFLDLFPNTQGMTLVIPKQHFPSYAMEMNDDNFVSLFLAAKIVAKKIDKALKTKRTALVMEGMGINHAHIKLYPLHGLKDEWKPVETPEQLFFERYPGYLSTKMGPKADISKLYTLAEKIRNSIVG